MYVYRYYTNCTSSIILLLCINICRGQQQALLNSSSHIPSHAVNICILYGYIVLPSVIKQRDIYGGTHAVNTQQILSQYYEPSL